MSVHFSSKSDDWETPQGFYDEMNARYGPFDIDVACSKKNCKAPAGYALDAGLDGLRANWSGITPRKAWMNPPYGREISKWVKKAYEESQKGVTVVCLLPARTDTKWFHDYCTLGQIEFLKGRLKFGGSKNSAPFPSMVVVFGKAYQDGNQ